MKRLFLMIVILVLSTSYIKAQVRVVEIRWIDCEQTTYQGVIVMDSDSQGKLYSKFYHPSAGIVYVSQQVTMSHNYDLFGNCTSYLYCSYPNTTPYVPYTADNFIFYPNGAIYTQDYSGKWSTVVQQRLVPVDYWSDVIRSYRP